MACNILYGKIRNRVIGLITDSLIISATSKENYFRVCRFYTVLTVWKDNNISKYTHSQNKCSAACYCTSCEYTQIWVLHFSPLYPDTSSVITADDGFIRWALYQDRYSGCDVKVPWSLKMTNLLATSVYTFVHFTGQLK